MSKEDLEIRNRRLEKLEFYKEQGINPYPYSFNKKYTSEEIKSKFSKLKKEEKTKSKGSSSYQGGEGGWCSIS